MYFLLKSLCWGTVLGGLFFIFGEGGPVLGAEPAGKPNETGKTDQANSSSNLEKLLDLADRDIGKLSQVRVHASEATTSTAPSLASTVSSVGRTEEPLGKSPAAVFVITSEMIRRSTATTIPDLLRMVPGLTVAQVDSNVWSISSRGGADPMADKMLVMIDGRIVYNPLFSGVYWDVQDLLLEDIERIEVIRGPGAALWGPNAVNGVISIVTKNAKNTQGAMITYGGGTHDQALGGLRYGGQNGEGLSWRVWGKQFERGPGWDPDGAHDSWRQGRGGFRVDWEPDRDQTDAMTVQGDYYGGESGHELYNIPDPDIAPPYRRTIIEYEGVSGANVLGRWKHKFSDDSDVTFLSYYNRSFRSQQLLTQKMDTFDAEFQHRFPLASRHEILWGLQYRQISSNIQDDGFVWHFDPEIRTMDYFGGFVQDKITLKEDRWFLTLGTRLDADYFSDFQYQPTVRLSYTPDDKQTYWAAVSRAVHTPDLLQRDNWSTRGVVPYGPYYFFTRYQGVADTVAEQMLAYELGYRRQLTERFSYDVSAFCNVYEDLIYFQFGTPYSIGDNRFIWPIYLRNGGNARMFGAEIWAHWAVTPTWELSASFSGVYGDWRGPDDAFIRPSDFSDRSPHNQARLYSSWKLSPRWEFDMGLRYVDSIVSGSLPEFAVPEYLMLDARLAWHPKKHVEFAVIGQNLLDNHHLEFNSGRWMTTSTEVPRAVYAKATWRY
ncbi:MAG: TonB-dependent receptor [Pirellulales bacterium]|nr:TonB-dependent receptor [Pirellulales bacterium]